MYYKRQLRDQAYRHAFDALHYHALSPEDGYLAVSEVHKFDLKGPFPSDYTSCSQVMAWFHVWQLRQVLGYVMVISQQSINTDVQGNTAIEEAASRKIISSKSIKYVNEQYLNSHPV
jgi:hypothetical protein